MPHPAPTTATSPPDQTLSASAFYRRIWHWHFFAGLVCVPFAFLLALTGALYLFHDQIDDAVYANQLIRPAGSATTPLPPAQWIDAASKAQPGRPTALYVPKDERHAAQIDVATPAGAVQQVFVDPSDAKVLGTLAESARLMTFVKNLHSLTVAGTAGNVVIEIVAGWIIVLMLTGAYLWWPRGRKGGVVSIRPGARGRAWWRDLHAVTGAFGGVIILFLALTGMPWSVFWGQQVNQWAGRHGLGVPDGMWRNVPRSTLPSTALGDVPWTLEQQPVPASADKDPHAGHHMDAARPAPAAASTATSASASTSTSTSTSASTATSAIGVDKAIAIAREAGMTHGFKLALPRGDRGVYSAVRMPGQLDGQRVLHIDQYSGRILMDIGADRIGAVGRVTQWGVSVHQGGEYGWPNLLMMLLGCLALMTLCVSGVTAWWKRRPAGSFAAPPRRHGDRLMAGALAIAIIAGIVFPLLGASMLLAAAADYGWSLRTRVRTMA
ncbi:putative iron-regulated membrane protein [Pseudoduganella lurida]|uniref:Putative iron-regulated membrane protein n=1 Tax=Pseudoduganella lurida TaxID=1036180 RepID=A0A562RLW3_9BURK|nr:PepSY domain-containing protein [Pseudoduganella lurida]TWI69999.1 putative iron-regulated membrane protein [Pseudoduganella lurida]